MTQIRTEKVILKETAAPATRAGWYAAIVLMLCYALSFVDRAILGLLVPQIEADLGISDTLMALLQGFSFALFYAVMGLPLGRIADRANRRNLISVCIAFWSLFTAACAGAKSYAILFLARMGVGIGEAGLHPASYSILSDYFAKERLGKALSVYYMGQVLGSALALSVGGTVVQIVTRKPDITLPVLGSIASWRLTFLIVGLPGFLFALLLLTLREPVRKDVLRTSFGKEKLSLSETLAEVRKRWQSVAGISVGFIFHAACLYGFTAWVPPYFLRVHGWSIGEAGRALGLLVISFGCLGLYVGGYLSERWQRRGSVDAPLRVAIPCAIGILLFLVPAMLMPTAAWSLALIGPGMFCLVLPMGTVGAALTVIFPNQVRAQVSALYLFILNLGGLTLGPLLPGVFTDYLFKDQKMVGASIALTMAISGAIMLTIYLVTLRPYRAHYQMMQQFGDSPETAGIPPAS
jgi:MFS family permease